MCVPTLGPAVAPSGSSITATYQNISFTLFRAFRGLMVIQKGSVLSEAILGVSFWCAKPATEDGMVARVGNSGIAKRLHG